MAKQEITPVYGQTVTTPIIKVLIEWFLEKSWKWNSSRAQYLQSAFSVLHILDLYPTDLNKWKTSEDPLGGVFLFDIEKDPSESNNLASSHPDLVVKLLKEAEEQIKDAPPQEFGFVSNILLICLL